MTTAAQNHDVADLALADSGQARIEWADRHMPVLASIRERFAARSRSTASSSACACTSRPRPRTWSAR